MTAQNLNLKKGFTLIELLVVIGILAVLLTITLIAINPGRQFAQANNTKRRSDINALLNSIHQFGADNKGAMPGTLSANPGNVYLVSNQDGAGGHSTATLPTGYTGVIDLCTDLMPTYLSSLPVDPGETDSTPISDCTVATGYNTGYGVAFGSATDATNRRVTVYAPGADLSVEPTGTTDISVTR